MSDATPSSPSSPPARRTIGASEVAAVLGLSPWTDPVELWGRLTGRLPPPAESPAMRRGRILEPGLRALAAERLGVDIHPGPTLAEPGWPVGAYGHARPDGWHIAGGAAGPVLHELKSTGSLARWTAEAPPPHYLAQVVWQLASSPPIEVGGQPEAVILTAYDVGTGDVAEYRVHRDERTERMIARIREVVEAWYERHILGDRCPDGLTAAGRALAGALSARAEGAGWIEPTPADRELVEAWRRARAAVRAAEAEAERCAVEIRARIGAAEGLRGLVRAGRPQRRTTLDASVVRRLAPEVAEAATVTSAPWRPLYDVTPPTPEDQR